MKTLVLFIILIMFGQYASGQTTGTIMQTQKISTLTGGMPSNSITYGSHFGCSVDTIGDLNNDGIIDLVVGAYVDNDGGTGRGAVYILFMDTNRNVSSYKKISSLTTSFVNNGIANGDGFGYRVAGIGDINNDGNPDIAIGSVKSNIGGTEKGNVHIINLNSNGTVLNHTQINDNTIGVTLTTNGWFSCVAGIGDIDNDGVPDLAVGNARDNQGSVWIFRLNSNGTIKGTYEISNGVTNFSNALSYDDRFGVSVNSIGDIDNDGVPDIIAGAFYDDDGGYNSGAAYVIFLNSNGSVKSYSKISNSTVSGSPYSGQFGSSVCAIPDLDGNGISDLLIGAYAHSGYTGTFYRININSSGGVITTQSYSGSTVGNNGSNDRLGWGISPYTDLNNNGYMEVCVGAARDDDGGSSTGAIYILSLKQNLSVTTTTINNQCPADSTGVAVAVGNGANPPFTYLWSNASTNDTISNLPAGTYTVTITNALNATATNTAIVSDPSPISLNTSGNHALCKGSSMAVTVIGNGGTGTKSIFWNHGLASANGHVISPNVTTTYSVYAIDANNCISDTTDIIITINPLPTVSFSGLNTTYCSNNANTTLAGSPAGGTFSGSGISGSVFNPSIANTGNNEIIYSYTDASGCIGKDTNSTNIISAPNILFSAINAAYCENDYGFALDTMVSPSGGNFLINGTANTNFYPAVLGSGTFNIKYEITNTEGCTDIDSTITFVNPSPNASFSGLNTSYCDIDTTVNLIGSPSGGTFSGNGISSNSFNPSNAGSGYKSVTYSYSNYFGCSDTVIHSTTVNALTDINVSTADSMFCNNDGTVNITMNPIGGILSGVGVNNTSKTFNPTIAGTGLSSIIYTFTNPHGCTSIDTHSVDINSPVSLSFTSLANNYCLNNSPIALVANYSGGVFYGNGVSNNSLNPSSAGVGSHIISYKYDNGCEDTIHQNVSINAIPVISINGLASSYCQNDDSITLTASPNGGSFSGNGVTGNILKPSIAGIGISSVQYISAADANGCLDTVSQSFTINSIPSISFNNLTSDQCINTSTVSLSALPAGGSFTGDYISLDNFMPDNSGIGNHKVFYNVTDVNSCSNLDSFTFIVHDLPSISFNVGTSCSNISSMNLNATPNGGSYSGNNVTGSIFNPTTAGVGSHEVTYTYTDNYLCTNIDTQNVIVYNIPNIVFNISNTDICSNAAPIVLSASPGGGTYAGNGIVFNVFNPGSAGVGSHDIIYTTSDANLCTNSDTNTLIVHSLPSISFSNYSNTNCINNANDTIGVSPMGGSFSGAGMSDSIFSPFTAGVGNHIIHYSIADNYGCSNIDSISIDVFTNPVLSIISGLSAQNCQNDSAYFIDISPNSGTYSSSFIISDTIYPALAPIGKFGFTYIFTDANNCTSSVTDSAYNYNSPIANAGNDTVIPCNSTGIIIGEGSYANTTFMWSPILGINNPFISNPIANPSQNTVYTVIKTDINTNCSSKDSISIIIPNNAVVEIIGDTVICPGDSIHISVIGADTFYWDNGITGSNYDNLIPITQYVSVYGIDSNNCSDNDSVVILLLPKPQPFLGNDTAIYHSQILSLDAGVYQSYQWNTGHTSQSINVDANMLSNGIYDYSVAVENSYGCFGSDTITISITTGISDENSITSLKYYPNPVRDILNIEWSENDNISLISIYDIYGKNIRNIKIANTQLNVQIDMSPLAKGVYYLRINNKHSFKVIVE